MHRLPRFDRAATLIELVVLLTILGLLLLLASPYIGGDTRRTQDTDAKRHLAMAFNVLKRIALEEDEFPSSPVLRSRLERSLPMLDFAAGLPLTGVASPDTIGVEADGEDEAALCLKSRSGEFFTVRVVLGTDEQPANAGVYYGAGDSCTDGQRPATPGIPTTSPGGVAPAKGENERRDTEWIGDGSVGVFVQPPILLYPSTGGAPQISGNPGDSGGGTLTVTTGSWDPRYPVVSYEYQWVRCTTAPDVSPDDPDCTAIAGETGTSYTARPADMNQYLAVRVNATTAQGGETSVYSDPFRAANPPANTALPQITNTRGSGAPREQDVLTVSTGSWSGTQPIDYSYQWLRCDAAGSGCTAITGATASSYRLASADVGATVRAAVQAANVRWPDMNATAQTAATALVVVNPPQAPADGSSDSPQISDPSGGDPSVDDDTLTASPADWTFDPVGDPDDGSAAGGPGSQPMSFSWQWQSCTTTDPTSCANILGATGSTYAPTILDIDQRIRVCQTATNSAGSATSCSAMTGLVVDQPKQNGSPAPTVSGGTNPALTGQTLNGNSGAWTGTASGWTYSYEWLRCDLDGFSNCAVVQTAAVAGTPANQTGQAAYTVVAADQNKALKLRVTPTNSIGTAASPWTSPARQVATPPAAGATSAAKSGNTGASLSASLNANGWSTNYSWSSNCGGPYSAGTTSANGTVNGSASSLPQNSACSFSLNANSAGGSSLGANSVTIYTDHQCWDGGWYGYGVSCPAPPPPTPRIVFFQQDGAAWLSGGPGAGTWEAIVSWSCENTGESNIEGVTIYEASRTGFRAGSFSDPPSYGYLTLTCSGYGQSVSQTIQVNKP